MMYVFGDIVSINVAFSNQTETKVRPVCILARDKQDYVFLHMTSQLDNISWDPVIIPDISNNLKTSTRIKIKKISTYHESLFRKKIGSLSPTDKNNVQKKLRDFVNGL